MWTTVTNSNQQTTRSFPTPTATLGSPLDTNTEGGTLVYYAYTNWNQSDYNLWVDDANFAAVVPGKLLITTYLYDWTFAAYASGTGVFDDFLAASSASGAEIGTTYPTSPTDSSPYGGTVIADMAVGTNTTDEGFQTAKSKTDLLLTSNLPALAVNGVPYVEFRFDSNEPNNGTGNERLEEFIVFQADTAITLDQFLSGTAGSLVFDLDAGQDRAVDFVSPGAGSGRADLSLYVDYTAFDMSKQYTYVYYAVSNKQSGFDEWKYLTNLGSFTFAPDAPIKPYSPPAPPPPPPPPPAPSLSISKTVASVTGGIGGAADSAGDIINYEITVTNTGNVGIAHVIVSDPLAPDLAYSAGDTNTNGTLDVGESWTYTATHTVTQGDIDAGGNFDNDSTAGNESWRNVASVTADGIDEAGDDAVTAILRNPGVTIDKSVVSVEGGTNGAADSAGDIVHYSVVVSNSGNVTLTGVQLTDAMVSDLALASGDQNGNGKLDVGESWTYTASHVVTQAELDAASSLRNVATVNTDETAPQSDDAVVTLLQKPSISIHKAESSTSYSAAGQVIKYTVEVANTGNISLTHVNVSDPLLASLTRVLAGNGDSVLDVGETWKYTGSYTVTKADMQAGAIVNTATVSTDQTQAASDTVQAVMKWEGLSLGYWKNHASDWDLVSNGITSTSFEQVFFGTNADPWSWTDSSLGKKAVGDVTLTQALGLQGGGKYALARDAVAALLNSFDEDVSYRYTGTQIIKWVNDAFHNRAVDIGDGVHAWAAGDAAIIGLQQWLNANNMLDLQPATLPL